MLRELSGLCVCTERLDVVREVANLEGVDDVTVLTDDDGTREARELDSRVDAEMLTLPRIGSAIERVDAGAGSDDAEGSASERDVTRLRMNQSRRRHRERTLSWTSATRDDLRPSSPHLSSRLVCQAQL